jgi:hypothetical protein
MSVGFTEGAGKNSDWDLSRREATGTDGKRTSSGRIVKAENIFVTVGTLN